MTLTPTGPGLSLNVVSIALLTMSWVVVVARIIVRTGMKAFGLDDWMMVSGLVLYTLACQATITASFNGIGTHSNHINSYHDKQGRKWFMFFQIWYIASTVPIKCAICIALLRITQQRKYRYSLWIIMFLSAVGAIVTIVTVLVQCQPVAATWDKTLGHCIDTKAITNSSYFLSACSIVTDWSCAILPAFILWNIQLRFRIKASVVVVLALGVVASTATLVRLRYLLNYNSPDDYLYGLANIALWSIIESGVGLIAGSLPALRPLLRYIPFFASSLSNSGPSKDGVTTIGGGNTGNKSRLTGNHTHHHKLDTFRMSRGSMDGGDAVGVAIGHHHRDGGVADGEHSHTVACEAGKRNWEELSDAESQKYILKESHVTVTNEAVVGVEQVELDEFDQGLRHHANVHTHHHHHHHHRQHSRDSP
ncbi:Cation-transporting ATPAse 4 [Lasiodiplodia theobromae]|uniref:Cation-transporting ATPAse 4 n=1 Tax=Lasiodiplodia theobromae TaxID=45133 RepID=UPI0015C3633C|nr:Cation-transporting ATPAse 4 [Lasiodiplodia theobromae]KAF4535756.1 Cation-transporting ATPAse 4 [Lasiodiplodia theobromae]